MYYIIGKLFEWASGKIRKGKKSTGKVKFRAIFANGK